MIVLRLQMTRNPTGREQRGSSCRGTKKCVRLLRSWLTCILCCVQVIAQRYVKRPLLLDGYKWDLRLYVLVTSFQPLEAFIYKVRKDTLTHSTTAKTQFRRTTFPPSKAAGLCISFGRSPLMSCADVGPLCVPLLWLQEGFARISTERYGLHDLQNRLVHLTNSSIQKLSHTGPSDDSPLKTATSNLDAGGTKVRSSTHSSRHRKKQSEHREQGHKEAAVRHEAVLTCVPR